MNAPQLVISPDSKKIVITLYEHLKIETDDKGNRSLSAFPSRPIMTIPIDLPDYVISVSLGVTETEQ